MEGLDLKQALSVLERIQETPALAEGSRLALVSFVWIDTLCHHWPSRATPEMKELQDRFSFLKTIERSRYLKQRRIVLRHLVRQFAV